MEACDRKTSRKTRVSAVVAVVIYLVFVFSALVMIEDIATLGIVTCAATMLLFVGGFVIKKRNL